MSYDFEAAGSNQFAELDAPAYIITGYPFSLTCFVKIESIGGSTAVPFAMKRATLSDVPLALLAINTSSQVVSQFRQGPAGSLVDALITSPTMSTATWYHIALVCASRTSLKVYLDTNVAEDTTDSTDWHAETDLNRIVIGSNKVVANTHANYFDGKIAEASIWAGTALSATDIGNLTNGDLPSSIGAGPNHWWRMLNDTSTTLADEISTYDLTATGAVWSSDHPAMSGGASVVPMVSYYRMMQGA